MHREYEKDGLAVVSLDWLTSDLEDRDEVEAFLRKVEANFTNLILDDTPEAVDDWLKRHRFTFSPMVMLFDRNGKLAVAMQDPDDEKLKAEVKALLAAK